MNWLAFALASWVFFGLETGLRDALRVGSTQIAPSFVFVLVVFVALSAPVHTALGAALIAGAITDLLWPLPLSSGGVTYVLGPYALGYLIGAQLIVTIRALMMRRNPLTMGFLALVGGACAQVVVVALHTVRGLFYQGVEFNATSELVQRLGVAAYTGVLAVVLALLLIPMTPLFGFPDPKRRRVF